MVIKMNKTDSIINLMDGKDTVILDVIEYIYGEDFYDRLFNEIENLSDEDKDDLIDEIEFDLDKIKEEEK